MSKDLSVTIRLLDKSEHRKSQPNDISRMVSGPNGPGVELHTQLLNILHLLTHLLYQHFQFNRLSGSFAIV